ncbi:MAG: hypothetical protein Ct9H300mP11_13300 [Chloroflexota bacterium]|nr:MAG: hypothetical protein Ct9H300mP11_13300 [Chloroflexota bacterium]
MNNYEQNSEDNLDLSADVIVVGGGPAGSATATMLSRKGWKVNFSGEGEIPQGPRRRIPPTSFHPNPRGIGCTP